MPAPTAVQGNSPRKVAFASLVGTAIEFYDYYIYAVAAVLVFNSQFFPKGDPSAATLLSLSTLALAFLARPIGSALFGHFGDKIGRKTSLVAVGLYVRLNLHESAAFQKVEREGRKLQAPVSAVFKQHGGALVRGIFCMSTTYVLFYLMTAFVQVYSKSPAALSPAGYAMGLGIPANTFTDLLLLGAVVFGIFTTLGGIWADKLGRRTWLLWVTAGIVVLGLFMPAFLNQGTVLSVAAFIVVGMAVMGMTFGPMAALLPELFPTKFATPALRWPTTCPPSWGRPSPPWWPWN